MASVDARIASLMRDMLETMIHHKGIGLAAPQVGVLERVIVVDIAQREESETPLPPNLPNHGSTALLMANPEILRHGQTPFCYKEGCLSIPGQFAEVERPNDIELRYIDINNQPQRLTAQGLLSTCIQHEMDHLNGALFVDHLSALKRAMILRRVEKAKKLASQAEA